jgi:ankyrin repeat protein
MSLDETYEKSLLNIGAEKREYAQRLFQCLTVSIRPLRVDELAEILAIRFNSDSFPNYNAGWRSGDAKEAVLSACSSLITVANVDESQVVQFSHFSVKEFLTSERLATTGSELSRYHILPGPAHTVMAKACLSILVKLDDNVDKKTIENSPLALYAARHWIAHAQFNDVSSRIQDFMFRLFDPDKPHFRAWIWLYNPDRHWGNHMSTPHPTRPQASPLYYAASYGFRDVAEHLVYMHPQDLNARSGTRGTPLHAALDGMHQTIAMLLVDRGANTGCLDSQSRTPLHIACRGCTGIVSVLIDRGVDLDAEDDSRETPLHVASQWGCDDITRLLLDHGAETDQLDDGGWTPLHVASHEGDDKIVRLLFDHGADANRPDNGGWTPLHLASWEGHGHIVRILLNQGITVNHSDNGGWTPLHAASQEGHNDVVGLLLDHGADPNHANSDGSTSLHVAIQRNHQYIVRLLLDHGADLNYLNSDGSTSLHLASQRGHDNIVRLLLDHGADAIRLDGDGWTSLHLASQRGHNDVVRLLLDHGVDSNHAHSNGLTSLHLASQGGHHHIVRLLFDRGADANSPNSDGWTPLHFASQRGHDHIVRLLLEHGADADHPDSDSSTPIGLGFASRVGGVERKPPKGFGRTTRTRRRM